MVYSNLVSTGIRRADSLENMLDLVSFSNSGNILHKKNHGFPIFRPIRHNMFKEASVEFRNPNGDTISFPEGSFSAIELYIRPRQPPQS